MFTKGVVYLICDPATDLYKIGVTKSTTSKRLKQLQTGNGTELFLINKHESFYPYRVESMLHNHFRMKHELNEWYCLDHKDIVSFTEVCNNIEHIIEIMKDNPFFSKGLR